MVKSFSFKIRKKVNRLENLHKLNFPVHCFRLNTATIYINYFFSRRHFVTKILSLNLSWTGTILSHILILISTKKYSNAPSSAGMECWLVRQQIRRCDYPAREETMVSKLIWQSVDFIDGCMPRDDRPNNCKMNISRENFFKKSIPLSDVCPYCSVLKQKSKNRIFNKVCRCAEGDTSLFWKIINSQQKRQVFLEKEAQACNFSWSSKQINFSWVIFAKYILIRVKAFQAVVWIGHTKARHSQNPDFVYGIFGFLANDLRKQWRWKSKLGDILMHAI